MLSKMGEFILIVDVPTKMALLNIDDKECLAEYRTLRTELLEEYKVWEVIKQYPDELGFILQEKNYEMYVSTFENKNDVPITEEQFNLVKDYFKKENYDEDCN